MHALFVGASVAEGLRMEYIICYFDCASDAEGLGMEYMRMRFSLAPLSPKA